MNKIFTLKNCVVGSFLCGGFTYLYKNNSSNNQNDKKKLVIIGNGWGSHYLQKYINDDKFSKTIIANNKNMLYTPNLVSSLYEDAVTEINNNNIIIDTATKIDYKNKELQTNNNKYSYDDVIFCTGSETNDYNIDGVKEYSIKFKTIKDRDELKNKLKNKNIKKIVIIGSGAVGIELSSLLESKGYDVTIIEGLKEILPGFTNQTKENIEKYLEEKNIKLIKQNFVKSITESKVVTDKSDIDYDLVIWSGGIKFNGYESTVLYKLLSEKAKIVPRGINVKDNFSVDDENNVYCVGAMVANKGPPTAQNAKNQAQWLSEYLNKDKNNENDFIIHEKGKILHLNKKIYVESDLYNGYIHKPFSYVIDFAIKYY